MIKFRKPKNIRRIFSIIAVVFMAVTVIPVTGFAIERNAKATGTDIIILMDTSRNMLSYVTDIPTETICHGTWRYKGGNKRQCDGCGAIKMRGVKPDTPHDDVVSADGIYALQLEKDAACMLVDEAIKQDAAGKNRICIISFAESAEVKTELLNIQNADNVKNIIREQKADGEQDYAATLSVAENMLDKSRNSKIVLFSGGNSSDNSGAVVADEIKKNNSNLKIHSVGFGLGDTTILSAISSGEGYFDEGNDLSGLTIVFDKITAEPTEPEQPVEPPTEPEQPVEPPVEPEQPVEPPVEPEQPVEPPVEPEQPVEPPVEPEQPVEPPVEPEQPVEPPVEPEQPVEPPVEPEQPVEPPVEPEQPVEPPVEPEQPVEPPVEPEQPVEPPVEPEQPVEPPTEPEKPPTEPEKPPTEPEKPSVEPEKPPIVREEPPIVWVELPIVQEEPVPAVEEPAEPQSLTELENPIEIEEPKEPEKAAEPTEPIKQTEKRNIVHFIEDKTPTTETKKVEENSANSVDREKPVKSQKEDELKTTENITDNNIPMEDYEEKDRTVDDIIAGAVTAVLSLLCFLAKKIL